MTALKITKEGEKMSVPENFNLADSVALLRRTPAVLEALLTDLPDVWQIADEGRDTWNARDVLGHLIHAEETDWIPRVRHILEYGEAQPFPPFDRLAQFERFGGFDTPTLLRLFRQRRVESLVALAELNLTPAQLELTGAHPALGRVTMTQLLATWTVHDLTHIAQIVRVMAKRYVIDVGPWKAYLSILTK